MSDEPRNLMAALRASIDQARAERDFKRDALTARARGDWEAERHALDGLILLERGRLGETPPAEDAKSMCVTCGNYHPTASHWKCAANEAAGLHADGLDPNAPEDDD